MKQGWIAVVALVALAVLGSDGEAQEPPTEKSWMCSAFNVSGMATLARVDEDRDGKASWIVHAAELPPGWEPLGTVVQGNSTLIVACKSGIGRSDWGENRLTIDP